jgi:hypothetical protein
MRHLPIMISVWLQQHSLHHVGRASTCAPLPEAFNTSHWAKASIKQNKADWNVQYHETGALLSIFSFVSVLFAVFTSSTHFTI